MFRPPPKRGSLDSTCRGRNAKSGSKPPFFNPRQILLPALVAVSIIVYGFTKNEQLLPITHMLVAAFLCSMGLNPPKDDVKE